MACAATPQIESMGSLAGKRWEYQDFSGMYLRKADMRRAVFFNCNFDNADMTEADCTGSDFSGSTARGTNCYYTNFTRCKLPSVFEPKDAFGMTVTLECSTFTGVQVSQLYWYSWLMLLAQMTPATTPVKENLRDGLIALIGSTRYVKLLTLFRREI